MNSHLSEEQISAWISGERGGEAASHVRECHECTAELEQTQRAMTLFRTSGHQAADYWKKRPAPARSRTVGWVVAATAVALAVVIAVSIPHRPLPQKPAPHAKQEMFTRIPYVVPPAPYERTEIVHMDVPVAALIAAGLKMDQPAGDSVSADILIGQDGRPLAVGFPERN